MQISATMSVVGGRDGIPTEAMMDAQIFNHKFFSKMWVLTPNFAFKNKNFSIRIFLQFRQPKIWWPGQNISSSAGHGATGCNIIGLQDCRLRL